MIRHSLGPGLFDSPTPFEPGVRRRRKMITGFALAVVLCISSSLGLAGVATAFAHDDQSQAEVQTPWPGGVWEPGPPQFGTIVDHNVRVPMDDGVTLSANIAYPADLVTGQRAPGQFPVIIRYTPYTDANVPFFVERGYINLNVRSRGTGLSGGTPPSHTVAGNSLTATDGVAILRFARNLAGSNGELGMFGCSGEGNNILTTLKAAPRDSGVKTIIPACKSYGWQYRETFFASGIPTQSVAILTHLPQTPPDIQAFLNSIFSGGSLAFAGDPYWQDTDRTPVPQIVDDGISTLFWTNWTDIQVQGALSMYSALQNQYRNRTEYLPMRPHQPATSRYQIIVGSPTGHGGGLDTGIMLEWFDTWLKHKETTLDKTHTPIHLFEEGTNRWVNAAQYPLTARDYTPYYLDVSGTLGATRPNQAGSEQLNFALPTDPRGSVAYTSAPIEDGATLAGPMSVTAYASTTGTNLTLIGTLYDVAPDGTAAQITTGTAQASRRALDPSRTWYDGDGVVTRPWETQLRDDYVQPGQTNAYTIGLLPRLWSVLPGHSLRVTLTTRSTAATCAAPLGNDACAYTAPELQTLPGVYTVYHGPSMGSTVNLPLLPYRYFATVNGGPTPDSTVTQPLDWGIPGRGENVGE